MNSREGNFGKIFSKLSDCPSINNILDLSSENIGCSLYIIYL